MNSVCRHPNRPNFSKLGCWCHHLNHRGAVPKISPRNWLRPCCPRRGMSRRPRHCVCCAFLAPYYTVVARVVFCTHSGPRRTRKSGSGPEGPLTCRRRRRSVASRRNKLRYSQVGRGGSRRGQGNACSFPFYQLKIESSTYGA